MSTPTGPLLPSADTLLSLEYGKFVLSNLAAKRARQLKEGATPLVRCESSHPLSIALAEIAAGKIRPVLGKEEPELAVIETDVTALDHEVVPGELGILLPALDETETDLLGVAALTGEEDVEHDEDAEAAAVPTLGDLLDDDSDADVEVVPEAEEIAPVEPGSEDTVSLTDLEDQEGLDDEGDLPDA